MASEKGGRWAKENLDYYNDKHFIKDDRTMDMTTNVQTITKIMLPYGLKQDNTYQDFNDLITFYPKDYFCPKSYKEDKIYITKNTVTIHHFAGGWLTRKEKNVIILSQILGKRAMKVLSSIKRFCCQK